MEADRWRLSKTADCPISSIPAFHRRTGGHHVLLQRQEARLPEAGEPEGQTPGLHRKADREVPRQGQGSSLRAQEGGVVGGVSRVARAIGRRGPESAARLLRNSCRGLACLLRVVRRPGVGRSGQWRGRRRTGILEYWNGEGMEEREHADLPVFQYSTIPPFQSPSSHSGAFY